MRKALFTIAYGQHLDLWRNFAEPFWRLFCRRHNYDLYCFSEPIDTTHRATERSIAWQKLIAHEQEILHDYDLLVWLDADIVINPGAPDPADQRSAGKVGACLEFDWGQDPQTAHLAASWKAKQRRTFAQAGIDFESYPKLWGFDPSAGPLINSGFFLFEPQCHGALLREVYDTYDDRNVQHWGEMVPLSEELHRRQVFEALDPRYNLLVVPFLDTLLSGDTLAKPRETGALSMIYRLLNDGYFIHFAGRKLWGMPLLSGARWTHQGGFEPPEGW